MAKKKKNGNKDRIVQTLVFVTAILNLIRSAFDLLSKLLE